MFLPNVKLDFLQSRLKMHINAGIFFPLGCTAFICPASVTLARGLLLRRLTLSRVLLLCEFRLWRQMLGRRHKSAHIQLVSDRRLKMTGRTDQRYLI
jgi:hypothetical protein